MFHCPSGDADVAAVGRLLRCGSPSLVLTTFYPMPHSGLHRVQPTTPVLETDNWGVAYGDKVILNGLQLQIAPNAITALMGPVGGGKST